MKLKNVILLGLAVVTSAALLGGCGGDKKADQMKEVPKKIVIGLDDNFPPMGFHDEKGDLVGFDIDLAKAAAKKLGTEVEFKPIDWSAKEAELSSGRIDAIWNGLSITEDRKKNILFSNPYMENEQIIVVPVNSPIQSKADLAGKIVAVQDGSTAVDAIEKDKGAIASFKEFKKYGDNISALMDVEAGRADAVVLDSIVGRYYMQKQKGVFRIVNDSFDKEYFAVGFAKDNKALADKFNEALKELKDDGTAQKISEKWFGADVIVKDK